jgi:tetratricopeptide (TPR) repeat protein
MNKHLILAAAASLALAGVVRADDAKPAADAKPMAAKAEAKPMAAKADAKAMDAKADAKPAAAATPVAKMDKAGSLAAGKLLLDDGKFAEAAAYFEGIGEQVAENGAKKREPWRLNNWALALFNDKQYDKAIEVATKLTTSNPEISSGWNTLAGAQAASGKREDAIATYDKGIAKLKELGADAGKLEANKQALMDAKEAGKPKKVKEAEAKAKAAADAAAAKAAAAKPAEAKADAKSADAKPAADAAAAKK